jgi:hypothetical protein
MTEPNNIGLLGSGRLIVLDDGAVTEIVSAPRCRSDQRMASPTVTL